MKVKVEKAELMKLLSQAADIAKSNTATKILENIMITASPENTINVRATNLSISVQNIGNCDTLDPGTILIDGATIYKAVSTLDSSELELETVDNSVVLKSGNTELEFNTMDTDNYPTLIFPADSEFERIEKTSLLEGLNRTSFSISQDETKPHMMGIHVVYGEEKLIIESTDGHAAARYVVDNPDTVRTGEKGIILESRGIQHLVKFLSSYPEVKISIEGTKRIHLQYAKLNYLTLSLVDSKFPPLASVFPKLQEDNKIVAPKTPLLSAIKRITIFGDKKADTGVELNIDGQVCSITTLERVKGKSKDKVFITATIERKVHNAVSAQLFESIISSIPGKDMEIYLDSNEKAAIVCKPVDSLEYITILMPLRIT